MKILLIDPPWYSLQGISSTPIPLGLGYLGAILKKDGHNCVILSGEVGITKKIKHQKVVLKEGEDDFNSLKYNCEWSIFTEKLFRLLKNFEAEIVCITVPTVKYDVALEISQLIKKYNNNIKIVVGGPHPTIVPDDFSNIPEIDFIVTGEGEITISELVKAIEGNKKDFSKIKGLIYKKNGISVHNPKRQYIQNLDSLPFPDWSMLYEREKVPRNLLGHIISSRGCPYQCIFCASKKIWGIETRYRSPKNIFDEMKEKNLKYGVDLFNFNDDSFTLGPKRVITLCNLLIKSGLNISWKCDTRVNLVTYELLKKMKDAGCVHISMGIECGNDKMLHYIKKGITIDQVIKAFSIANKLGITTMAYFMMGFPNETKSDILDAVKLMKKIKPSHPCWSIATPYPGTELYDMCKKEGLISDNIKWSKFHHHSKKMGFSKNINHEEFIRLAEKIEKITFRMKLKYYLTHPKRLLKELKII